MLLLASKSPRRAQILTLAGYTFTQLESPFTDPLQPDPSSSGLKGALDLAQALAAQKAHALASSPLITSIPSPVILAADTICVDDAGRLIGTPDSPASAEKMIHAFENKTHHVVTGCCILTPSTNLQTLFADAATVLVGHIGQPRITAYLATSKWQGKAGGYNLSDRVSDGWPITVTGDHDTVTGLPITPLKPLLARHGILPNPKP